MVRVVFAGREQSYMDNKVPGKEVTPELARELLIAISNSVPDNVPSPETATKKVDGGANGVAMVNGDGADKYRSDLISLSYTSPDVIVSPLPNHAAW